MPSSGTSGHLGLTRQLSKKFGSLSPQELEDGMKECRLLGHAWAIYKAVVILKPVVTDGVFW